MKNHRKSINQIDFLCCFAEEYEIKPEDNKFYFFNPFSVLIFIKIVENILASVEEHERPVELILYYPSDDYIYFLENSTPFVLKDEVVLHKLYNRDSRERFLVYELDYLNN